ncbi:class I SAM-dependent RNA methyltransferase [Thalassococcus sp. S3]|uniref:class I SAM-dependent RNA methyltransferase n=1 Tax=Thalassococcus sp. S3 TaxID=2017482 RepID=UPI0010240D0B|nr:class I SAM-dependent RNA methyltransferase [Thalassococcus sp. S3]QBF34116.1 RNA methyltransferase [Thalassococcus sp. S3]
MTAQYLIQRLVPNGDGVTEGRLYAKGVLPGEIVSGEVAAPTLTDVRIIEPSEHRVKPPCRHARSCGGCQLQHASDVFVAEWKVSGVRRALSARGIEAEMRPIVTSPPRTRRRATLAAKRTKKGVTAGFHRAASFEVVPISDCHVMHPDLLDALPVIERLAGMGASRKGKLAVTVTVSEGGLDVSVRHGKPLDGPLRADLAQATEQLRLARLAWESEVVAMRAPPVQCFGAAQVVPPPGAFLQATKHGEQALLEAVSEATANAKHIADLFAGCGTFTLPLAEGAEVHAVEGEAEMIAALDQGWRKAKGLKRVTGEARDLFRRPLLPDELARFDALVIDPPRAGAEAQVAEIAKSQIPRIAYVSCDPLTFARDAQTLISAGYRLNWVQVVDQFRWSSHIELAASFTLAHMAAGD